MLCLMSMILCVELFIFNNYLSICIVLYLSIEKVMLRHYYRHFRLPVCPLIGVMSTIIVLVS